MVVHARDALWSMDATHVGRTPAGAKVESEAVREVRSTRTIGLSVGPPATSEEVVVVLECAKRERGTAPLVLISDNGSPYRGQHVAHWCAENGVLQLFTIPRTPQHNPASEHGMGELKRGTPLGKGTLVLDNAAACALLVRRRNQLDGRRLRPTRGWRTAVDFDRASPSWDTLVRREVFYREGTCAIQRAVLDSNTGRERRRAEREAILATLERFSVITRTRGGRPWSAQ